MSDESPPADPRDEPIGPFLEALVDEARTKTGRRFPDRSRKQIYEGTTGDKLGAEWRKQRSDAKEQAKVVVLGLLRQGKTITECMDAVGRSDKTFWNWKRESTKFRNQAVAAVEAWQRSVSKSELSWRDQQDLVEPVRREDFKTWAEYVVAFRKAYFGFDTFDHQWQILEAWDKSPPGGITLMLLAPRAGKTTLLLDSVVADLCSDPNQRIALVSEAQDFARKMMGRIQRRLSFDGGVPPPLIEHYGPFQPIGVRGKKWNSDEFTLLAADHDEQDPSCVSVGIGSNIRGARWDKVYLDDVQSLRTQGNTSKYLEVFRGDIITRPGRGGRIMITGSRVARGDFYEELERLEIVSNVIVMPALDLSKPVGKQSYFPRMWRDEQGRVTDDPVRGVSAITEENGDQVGWSDEDLAVRRKAVGEDQWSRVYMMHPQSDHSAMLNPQDIVDATDQRHVGAPIGLSNILSLDPSLHAHAAFTACGYDAEHLYVLDVVDLYRPTTNQKIYAEMERLTSRYKPDYWTIEANTLQSGYLTDDAFLELKAKWGFNAVPHHTSGYNKPDQQLGVPAMMNAIVRGEIRFPTINDENVGMSRLFDQLVSWRPDIPTKRLVQDEVMSLWFAYLLWRKLREQVTHDLSGWKREGMGRPTLYPWARTNLEGLSPESAARTPVSYEQEWERLARGAS